MDAVETEGDLFTGMQHAPSVRFTESKASSGDSTASMCGSLEDVLDSTSVAGNSRRNSLSIAGEGLSRRQVTRFPLLNGHL
jgi:hypothetical protein